MLIIHTIQEAAVYHWVTDAQGGEISPRDERLEHIAPYALFGGYVTLGSGVVIGRNSRISDGCTVLDGARIGDEAYLGFETEIGEDAMLGDTVTLVGANEIGRAAVIGAGVILGRKVSVPDRANIGPGIVVPRPDMLTTIDHVGPDGLLLSIYASEHGAVVNIAGHEYSYIELVHGSGIWEMLSDRERRSVGTACAVVQRNYDARIRAVARLQKRSITLRK